MREARESIRAGRLARWVEATLSRMQERDEVGD